ncbi:hypothetical protein P8C59_002744 [Phyllachora maydis]|uniref:Laccase n=1 Tax=Phyllachora maydis TaxID=1825666 RepID=A0AAD9MBR2_9PEZI|nr:hypothetical protein P8C59_002744 [Phyllachora maydis]
MGLVALLVTFLVDVATFTGNVFNPSTYGAEHAPAGLLADLGRDGQIPLLADGQAPAHADGAVVAFHPDGASAGFTCRYPELSAARWKPCNTKDSRDCWIRSAAQPGRRFDVHTDYELPERVPRGQTREYWITVGNHTVSPDGIPKAALVFNGTYPGPLLEACWGDQLVVHVTNTLPDQGTTVHWHGIRQLGSPEMDGVPLTQCPIPGRGGSFTYNFTALQYGHTWYHSHYSLQYPDGLAAPLVIYGPSSADWDVAVPPLLLADWLDTPAAVPFVRQEEQGRAGTVDAIVVNGRGHDPVTSAGSYDVTRFQRGKKHVLRLINGAAATSFVFSIDNHRLTVVAADLVAVVPYTVTSLLVGIGQRYTVVVDGLADPGPNGHFWVRTHPATGCNGFNAGTFNATFAPFDVRTALVSYDDAAAPVRLPDCTSHSHDRAGADLACRDEPAAHLRPVVPWTVARAPLNELDRSTFIPANEAAPDAGLPAQGRYKHWELRLNQTVENRTGEVRHAPFWIDFGNPTLLNVTGAGRDPYYNIIDYDFPRDEDGFVYMVIDDKRAGPLGDNTTGLGIAHPMHWHGSDVVILAQSDAPYDPATSLGRDNWTFANPARRDVALVPAGGYLAVAFRPDNPGAWLVHCHIAFHASAGLALQMVVQPSKVDEAVGEPGRAEARRLCAAWDAFQAEANVTANKIDSGI